MPFPHRTVLDATRRALGLGDAGVLALVLETEGSTYVGAGAAAWFGPDSNVGWLSGGCLEAEIAGHAAASARAGSIGWLELDSRDEAELLGGSAPGCRGRLRLALLPLGSLRGFADLIDAWTHRVEPMFLALDRVGNLQVRLSELAMLASLEAPPCPWRHDEAVWELRIEPLPRVAIFGAGPESTLLLPLLRSLGFRTLLVERRRRWSGCAAQADRWLELSPRDALNDPELARSHAALVMHHHFEFDREALEALADAPPEFVGLLGPRRRRDDLFKLLPAAAREALEPRLRSPIGLNLGGQGAEAIALSIAAQLQSWRHGD